MNEPKKIEGVIVPMASPFTTDGGIDVDSVVKIINYFSDAGVSAFIQGTTGEALSISDKERIRFAEEAAKTERNGLPLYAGISHHSFAGSLELARRFIERGVDILVAHLPAFYPLNNRQMLTYYKRLADSVPGPLLLYNNPLVVHMSIPLEVVEELGNHPNIWGIKDSERDIVRQNTLMDFCKGRKGFHHLMGWGTRSVYALTRGSAGIVPGSGNIVPHLYKQLYEAVRVGDVQTAEQLQEETEKISEIWTKNRALSEALAGLKVMMNELNLCCSTVLPPLTPLSTDDQQQIKRDMKTTVSAFKKV